MPRSTRWKSPRAQFVTSQDVLSMTSLPNSLWVQSRPSGLRFRVLATQHKSWVVSTKHRRRPLSVAVVESASQVAVQAVRAIPELRWGAVDVVVPDGPRQGQYSRALVEGFVTELSYTVNDEVIAGNFDAFCRWIVEGGGDSPVAVKVTVTGLVQGVGFRNWVKSEATRLGLEGWVRNADKDVEIRVQGLNSGVRELLEVCQQGPKNAGVADVVHKEVAIGEFRRFRIRRTVASEAVQRTSPAPE